MKVQLSKKDIIWSYVGTAISLLANVILIPVLVYFLDGEILGLWYIFTSIGAIATLFDFGFNVTFSRNITYCWSGAGKLEKENVIFAEQNKQVDFRLMKQVLETCKKIYLIIALAALLLMLIPGTAYIIYISQNIPGTAYIIAWFIYAMAVFMNLYYGYYSSFLRGVGAVGDANINTIISRMVQIIGTVVFLTCGLNLIGACLAYFLYGSTFRILGKKKFYAYHDIGAKLSAINDEKKNTNLFGMVWHNAWREGLVALSNFGSNQATTLICSLYLSLSETGIYSLGVQLATAIATISSTLYSAYQPELQSSYVTHNIRKVKKIMSIIVVSYIIMFVIGTVIVVVIGLPILKLIKPEINITVSVFLKLCLYQFLLKFRNCYTSYFSSTNRLIYYKAFICSAVICIILSFIFLGIYDLGITGLVAAQILSQIIYNVWYWAIKAHKEIDLHLFEMFRLSFEEAKLLIGRF